MSDAHAPPERRREQFLASLPQYEWRQDGTFLDIDGSSVRAYDDVLLLDEIAIEGDVEGAFVIPAGTVATVLFFQAEADGVAELECYWPENGFSFGFACTNRLRLHMANEQKYPRKG